MSPSRPPPHAAPSTRSSLRASSPASRCCPTSGAGFVPRASRPRSRPPRTADGTLPPMRGLLLAGDTERSAALRHEIPVPIGDPLLFGEVDGRRYVLTTRLESDRIQRELPDVQLLD